MSRWSRTDHDAVESARRGCSARDRDHRRLLAELELDDDPVFRVTDTHDDGAFHQYPVARQHPMDAFADTRYQAHHPSGLASARTSPTSPSPHPGTLPIRPQSAKVRRLSTSTAASNDNTTAGPTTQKLLSPFRLKQKVISMRARSQMSDASSRPALLLIADAIRQNITYRSRVLAELQAEPPSRVPLTQRQSYQQSAPLLPPRVLKRLNALRSTTLSVIELIRYFNEQPAASVDQATHWALVHEFREYALRICASDVDALLSSPWLACFFEAHGVSVLRNPLLDGVSLDSSELLLVSCQQSSTSMADSGGASTLVQLVLHRLEAFSRQVCRTHPGWQVLPQERVVRALLELLEIETHANATRMLPSFLQRPTTSVDYSQPIRRSVAALSRTERSPSMRRNGVGWRDTVVHAWGVDDEQDVDESEGYVCDAGDHGNKAEAPERRQSSTLYSFGAAATVNAMLPDSISKVYSPLDGQSPAVSPVRKGRKTKKTSGDDRINVDALPSSQSQPEEPADAKSTSTTPIAMRLDQGEELPVEQEDERAQSIITSALGKLPRFSLVGHALLGEDTVSTPAARAATNSSGSSSSTPMGSPAKNEPVPQTPITRKEEEEEGATHTLTLPTPAPTLPATQTKADTDALHSPQSNELSRILSLCRDVQLAAEDLNDWLQASRSTQIAPEVPLGLEDSSSRPLRAPLSTQFLECEIKRLRRMLRVWRAVILEIRFAKQSVRCRAAEHTIHRAVRHYLHQQRVQCLEEKHKAAGSIQRYWRLILQRGVIARRRIDFHRLHRAFKRTRFFTRTMQRQRHREQARRMLQHWWKRMYARRRARQARKERQYREKERRVIAIRRVQGAIREYMLRRRLRAFETQQRKLLFKAQLQTTKDRRDEEKRRKLESKRRLELKVVMEQAVREMERKWKEAELDRERIQSEYSMIERMRRRRQAVGTIRGFLRVCVLQRQLNEAARQREAWQRHERATRLLRSRMLWWKLSRSEQAQRQRWGEIQLELVERCAREARTAAAARTVRRFVEMWWVNLVLTRARVEWEAQEERKATIARRRALARERIARVVLEAAEQMRQEKAAAEEEESKRRYREELAKRQQDQEEAATARSRAIARQQIAHSVVTAAAHKRQALAEEKEKLERVQLAEEKMKQVNEEAVVARRQAAARKRVACVVVGAAAHMRATMAAEKEEFERNRMLAEAVRQKEAAEGDEKRQRKKKEDDAAEERQNRRERSTQSIRNWISAELARVRKEAAARDQERRKDEDARQRRMKEDFIRQERELAERGAWMEWVLATKHSSDAMATRGIGDAMASYQASLHMLQRCAMLERLRLRGLSRRTIAKWRLCVRANKQPYDSRIPDGSHVNGCEEAERRWRTTRMVEIQSTVLARKLQKWWLHWREKRRRIEEEVPTVEQKVNGGREKNKVDDEEDDGKSNEQREAEAASRLQRCVRAHRRSRRLRFRVFLSQYDGDEVARDIDNGFLLEKELDGALAHIYFTSGRAWMTLLAPSGSQYPCRARFDRVVTDRLLLAIEAATSAHQITQDSEGPSDKELRCALLTLGVDTAMLLHLSKQTSTDDATAVGTYTLDVSAVELPHFSRATRQLLHVRSMRLRTSHLAAKAQAATPSALFSIFDAVETASVDDALFLLQQGAHLDAVEPRLHRTALHMLSLCQEPLRYRLEMMTFLLERAQLDVDAQDVNGDTALHLFAGAGHLELVRHLLGPTASLRTHKADWRMTNKRGYTAMHCACHHDQVEVAVLLQQFVLSDASMGTTTNKNISDVPSVTATVHVSSRSNASLLLLQLHALDGSGKRPLHVLAEKGHLECVQQLISVDAMPDGDLRRELLSQWDRDGCTALHVATRMSHVDVVAELLDAAPGMVNCRDRRQRSSLHYAVAAMEAPDLVALLIEGHDADVHGVDERGDSALHWAARAGRTAIVRTLLAFGADPSQINSDWETGAQVALANGYLECARMLLPVGQCEESEPRQLELSREAPSARSYRYQNTHAIAANGGPSTHRPKNEYWDELHQEVQLVEESGQFSSEEEVEPSDWASDDGST